MKYAYSITDLGLIDYETALAIQKVTKKSLLKGENDGRILILEHSPAVYTIGRNGNKKNFLIPVTEIESGISRIKKTSRGGDVTFHEPGQVVVYFILPVVSKEADSFTTSVFNSIISFIHEKYSIRLNYKKERPGLWHEDKKICFGGFDLTGGVSMHGISINVSNKMEGFALINPCGYSDITVSSLSEVSGSVIDSADFRKKLRLYFLEFPIFSE